MMLKIKGNRLGGWVRVEGTNIDMPIIITSPGFYMDKKMLMAVMEKFIQDQIMKLIILV